MTVLNRYIIREFSKLFLIILSLESTKNPKFVQSKSDW